MALVPDRLKCWLPASLAAGLSGGIVLSIVMLAYPVSGRWDLLAPLTIDSLRLAALCTGLGLLLGSPIALVSGAAYARCAARKGASLGLLARALALSGVVGVLVALILSPLLYRGDIEPLLGAIVLGGAFAGSTAALVFISLTRHRSGAQPYWSDTVSQGET